MLRLRKWRNVMSKTEITLLKHLLLGQAMIMKCLAFNNAMLGDNMAKAADINIKLAAELECEVANELRKD